MNFPCLLVTLILVYQTYHDVAAHRNREAEPRPQLTSTKFSCPSEAMTDAEREVFLNYHNEARRRVAKGTEPNNVGTLGPAKNMYKLKWDCDMEKKALEAINKDCSYPGKSLNVWNDLPINLDIRYNHKGFPNRTSAIEQVLGDWWSAAKLYGVSDKFNRYIEDVLVSFAKMVLSKITKLGCAYKACDDGNMATVCLYNEMATTLGLQMWQTGKACESGSDCTTYDNSSCDDGLCIKDGKTGGEEQEEGKTSESTPTPSTQTTPTITTTPSTPTTSGTISNTSASGTQCPDIGAMTAEAREAVLAMHNKLRSSLARGLEKDGLGGNAPKASKMLKMVYDCEVEASAMKNAQQCIFEHSEGKFGENLFMTSELNADKVEAVKQASQEWWDELKKYGIGQENILTQELFYSTNQIGHYTQMAWETSYKLGCAVQHCADMTYVVCQYSPAGNALNKLIYTLGEPCQTDDGCPGLYTCSKEEGLCNVV